tara:strand:+ start:630 stop:1631 length:1002 start_codon:yes stop_codon:yes gene_type:complete
MMIIYKIYLIIIFLIISISKSFSQNKEAYLYSYFINNGADGLHLAYSQDGYNWKTLKNNKSFLTPTIGNDKLMRDPCIIYGPDKKFHMVYTISWRERSVGYAYSTDLINWSKQLKIPVMMHEENALNCWAPEIYYDSISKKYVIIWSTTIPGRFKETDNSGDSIHIHTPSRLEGKTDLILAYNHRLYYVTTKDFQNFSKTKLFFDQGFNVIDGSINKSAEDYILFLKDETRYPPQKNIRITSSKSLFNSFEPVSDPITGDYWAEGPSSIKIRDYWHVYFDKYMTTGNRMGAVKSKDLKNWTDISDEINFPENALHGSIFKVSQDVLNNLLKLE